MSTSPVIPKEFTAYRWQKAKDELKPATVAWTDPEYGQVAMKVLACGICGTDETVHRGRLPTKWPVIPGHEIVGEIVAVHPSVKNYKVGDRVGVAWIGGHCGTCHNCQLGHVVGCNTVWKWFTGSGVDGGYGEYAIARADSICPFPTDLDPAEAAPLLCAGLTTFKGLQSLNVPAGAKVAIHGIGGLGHLAIQYSRAMGYHTIAISSTSAKRDLALKLGAHTFIDSSQTDPVEELKKFGGVDVIVLTHPGSTNLVGGLGYQGKLLVLGLAEENPQFQCMQDEFTRSISVHGYLAGDVAGCIETLEFSQLHNIKPIVTKFPLSKAAEAYDSVAKAQGRVVLVA